MQSARIPLLAAALAAHAFAAPAHDAAAHDDEARLAEIAGFFEAAHVVAGPKIVDCKLSEGAETKCFSITVKPDPRDYTPGPWCPTNISDGADAGGIWFHEGEVVDVDGAFITRLAEIYGDAEWQLFDPETGAIRFTGTLEACEAAARPDVAPEYRNHCVQCLPEYMPEDASVTYVIPLEPVAAHRARPIFGSGAGIARNGVRLDGPAPVDAILGAHTIAPLDDCGGHVNLHVGYHYHAVTGCLNADAAEGEEHPAPIGIAMDGHPIYPHALADGSTPDDLDTCNGHDAEGLGYHYHAGEAGSNAILGCLTAQAGCTFEGGDKVCDATVRPPRP